MHCQTRTCSWTVRGTIAKLRSSSRIALIVAGIAAVLGIVLPARPAGASCAVFTTTDQGIGVQGNIAGNPENPGFAGTFHISIDNGPVTTAYCVDLQHFIFPNDSVCQITPTYPCEVVYILNNSYPVANNVGTQLSPISHEAAAVQAAIWHFTDNYTVTSPSDVVTRANAIISLAQSQCLSPPAVPHTINVTPSSKTNFLPDETSHSATATVLDTNGDPVAGTPIEVDVTGVSGAQTFNGTTDSNGNFTITYNNTFLTPGSDTITATVHFTASTGLEFKLHDGGERQGIVLAGPPRDASVSGTASKTWTQNTCGDGHVSTASGEECDDGNNTNGDTCEGDCTLPRCGNHIVDQGEQCDDGNTISGDGCSATCQKEICGNGVVDAHEECDDGPLNGTPGHCAINCTTPRCGNGVVDAGSSEECDDGNQINGDSCDNNCTVPRCGNHITDPNEQCDDGNNIDGDGCEHDCTLPRCGNGVKEGTEQCDDGNTVDGDGCEHDCTLPFCGNGIKDQNEQCDDGNNVNGDMCEADCTLPFCGNSIVDAPLGEQCDHGAANGTATDNCTATCQLREICGNLIDDDGNGLIDCDDPACPCEPFQRDPASITPRAKNFPTPYVFKTFGRVQPTTPIDPAHEVFGIVITSPNGVVYTATLPAGAIKPTAPKSTRYRFRDFNAKKGTGAYNGLALVQIDPHSNGYKVVIQAYGDFSKAAARMTVQFVIGNDEFFNKEVWSPTRRGGWVLHVN